MRRAQGCPLGVCSNSGNGAFPGSRVNRAWAEGRSGVVGNPHTALTPEAIAFDRGRTAYDFGGGPEEASTGWGNA